MQNLRLDQVLQELPKIVESKLDSTKKNHSIKYDLLLVISVFLIGMAAGNMYHPYQGILAISSGGFGFLVYSCIKIHSAMTTRHKMLLKEKTVSASVNERLQRHVEHSFRPHTKRRRGTLISERYRKLEYVPIAHVDEI